MTEQHRRSAASCKTYQEAERAVDHLPDHGFPVESVAITGRGLRVVEQVIGRDGLRQGHPSRSGERCAPRCPDRLAVRPCELARPRRFRFASRPVRVDLRSDRRRAVRLLHALQGGRRDFASPRSMQPSRYEVVLDEAVADEAVRLIGGLQTTGGGSTRT
ncbi:general stress protein [Streptomyces sp. NPDC048106]|uniref:general stress protein n=1 Tax=Streptomyces sp. NPDC048106 TaxID=3155750 RepID=UPI003453DCEF